MLLLWLVLVEEEEVVGHFTSAKLFVSFILYFLCVVCLLDSRELYEDIESASYEEERRGGYAYAYQPEESMYRISIVTLVGLKCWRLDYELASWTRTTSAETYWAGYFNTSQRVRDQNSL